MLLKSYKLFFKSQQTSRNLKVEVLMPKEVLGTQP